MSTALIKSLAGRVGRTLGSMGYKTLAVSSPRQFVYHVRLNRPEKRNALDMQMWTDMKSCMDELSENEDCRSIVLSGEGPMFSAGIDLTTLSGGAVSVESEDVARRAKAFRKLITFIQSSISSLEECSKPVLCAVHNACIGAAVHIAAAADMRYCTEDAWFQIKEVELGLAPDVGILQRMPKIVGSDSLVRELCYTARKFESDEAERCGFVSRVYGDRERMLEGVLTVAEAIAKRSPVAVQVTKASLNYSRDHSVRDGLEHVATWNQAMLQSEDFIRAATAALTKDPDVVFAKL